MLERMIDRLADEIGIDPVEVRRRNLIPPFADGHDVVTGLTYDSGNYQGALDKVLDARRTTTGCAPSRRRRARRAATSASASRTYVEICGLGPSQVAGAVGFQGGLGKARSSASIRAARCTCSSAPRRTDRARRRRSRRSSPTSSASASTTSRSSTATPTTRRWAGAPTAAATTAVGGAALAVATREDQGEGEADRRRTCSKPPSRTSTTRTGSSSSRGAGPAQDDPGHRADGQRRLEPAARHGAGLEATIFYDPPNFVYPFGAHVAVVEVDPETGHVELKRYVAVDDCGPQINPMIVEGQVHGGVVQGIGQALWEEAVYDDERAAPHRVDAATTRFRAPTCCRDIEVLSTVTPSPHHPLGVKGIGEAGHDRVDRARCTTPSSTRSSRSASQSIRMPLTPERVWRGSTIASAEGG